MCVCVGRGGCRNALLILPALSAELFLSPAPRGPAGLRIVRLLESRSVKAPLSRGTSDRRHPVASACNAGPTSPVCCRWKPMSPAGPKIVRNTSWTSSCLECLLSKPIYCRNWNLQDLSLGSNEIDNFFAQRADGDVTFAGLGVDAIFFFSLSFSSFYFLAVYSGSLSVRTHFRKSPLVGRPSVTE